MTATTDHHIELLKHMLGISVFPDRPESWGYRNRYEAARGTEPDRTLWTMVSMGLVRLVWSNDDSTGYRATRAGCELAGLPESSVAWAHVEPAL